MADTSTLKFQALESSVYCPLYKEENAIETVELDGEFDVEKIKTAVRDSVELLSYQKSHRPEILEILDVLDQNNANFLVDKQNYISFYWSGVLVLRVNVNRDSVNSHSKQLHVSLQKYKVEKAKLIDSNWNNFWINCAYSVSTFLTGVAAATVVMNRKSE